MAGECDECRQTPRDAAGHAGLAAEVAALTRALRARYYLTFACSRCKTRWVRHKIRAGVFEWLRIADPPDRDR